MNSALPATIRRPRRTDSPTPVCAEPPVCAEHSWRTRLRAAYADWDRPHSVRWLQRFLGAGFPRGWPVAGPLLAWMAATLIFWFTPADVAISRWFYDSENNRFVGEDSAFCELLYRRGTYPAVVIVTVGVLLLLHGLFISRNRLVGRAGLFLMLVMIVGPGLVVNSTLKNHWGRPRPNQILEFGGQHPFAPVAFPGELDRHNSSFPSGHAAAAFYLIAPAFLMDPRRRGWPTALMLIGISFGTAMSAARVMQGGHFASDVVWSAGFVYFTCVGMSWLFLRPRVRLHVDPVDSTSTACGT